MKKVIALVCLMLTAVAFADGVSFNPLNVGSVQMFAGVSEGRAVEVANQAIVDAVETNYLCTVARCASIMEMCRNYWLTNLTSKTLTLPYGYIGTLNVSDTYSFVINVTLLFPTDTRLSGDCILRLKVPSTIATGTINVSTKTGTCVAKHIYGVDASEAFSGESLFFFTRIGYENGTNYVLVTRQNIE